VARLVNVFLRGGADGLSLLVPIADPAYRTARPTQAIAAGAVLDVGLDGFGLHPAATRLAERFRSGSVAAVPAAGFDGQTRSHFEAQARLETGAAPSGAPPSGWLGRLLARGQGELPAPWRGVAVGAVSVPPSLWGTGDALGAPAPDALRLGALRPAARLGGYAVVDSPAAPELDALGTDWGAAAGLPPGVGLGARAAVEVVERLRTTQLPTPDPRAFGEGEAAAAFAAASALLDADWGTEVVQIDLGGWDTHDAQGTVDGTFAGLVAGLDAGLGALMDRHAGSDGLVVTVITEFGRRLRENASRGTDHGRGGLALVLGDGVSGGLRGTWPGLAELDEGDVRAVNDLRALQAEVVAHVAGLSGGDLDAVVPRPGGSAPLGLF